MAKCASCGGLGVFSGEVSCSECSGIGRVKVYDFTSTAPMPLGDPDVKWETCPRCNGRRTVTESGVCGRCRGSGLAPE
jgi:DnaJ-class molecular chaperone